VVALSDVPKVLRDATVAIEDKDFYNHPGFDLRGIVRASISNLQGAELQGGSTITQQLIKSAFLTPEPTIIRKLREIALAFWAERIYSKDEIIGGQITWFIIFIVLRFSLFIIVSNPIQFIF